jgi:hypothetical protein
VDTTNALPANNEFRALVQLIKGDDFDFGLRLPVQLERFHLFAIDAVGSLKLTKSPDNEHLARARCRKVDTRRSSIGLSRLFDLIRQ